MASNRPWPPSVWSFWKTLDSFGIRTLPLGRSAWMSFENTTASMEIAMSLLRLRRIPSLPLGSNVSEGRLIYGTLYAKDLRTGKRHTLTSNAFVCWCFSYADNTNCCKKEKRVTWLWNGWRSFNVSDFAGEYRNRKSITHRFSWKWKKRVENQSFGNKKLSRLSLKEGEVRYCFCFHIFWQLCFWHQLVF